ncbi:DUF2162 family putative transporter [uncultured Desulfobacter sp.]|uniref:DUF2162 family putative transporter n=1 Tax=uncultured Desulfobacter sp. TaxID=240139 RepID=UPI002AA926F5|nr:DUF2162 family putative transporter [uncultured Desulfobacter sp.]
MYPIHPASWIPMVNPTTPTMFKTVHMLKPGSVFISNQYGMAVHFALALGLFVWGAVLLGSQPRHWHASLSPGILLVLPCPVCATVILFNLSLAFSLYSKLFYTRSQRHCWYRWRPC